MTLRDKVPKTFAWLRSDEWKWFALPDVLFVLILFAFWMMVR